MRGLPCGPIREAGNGLARGAQQLRRSRQPGDFIRAKAGGRRRFARALAVRAADPHYVSRVVEISVDFDGSRCEWTLTDQGKGFDFDRVNQCEPASEADLLRPSGRGILMMRALMDEVRYDAGGRRVILTLRRRGEEQRHQARIEGQIPVQVAPIRLDGSIDWQAAQEAISRNLSLGGMALFQAKLASTHRVLIAMATEGNTLYLPAEVRHCRSIGEGMVELGCRFQPGSVNAPAGSATGHAADAEEAVGRLIDDFQNADEVQDERRPPPGGLFRAGRDHRHLTGRAHLRLRATFREAASP